MTYARIISGAAEELTGAPINSTHTFQVDGEDRTEDVQFSYATMLLWSDAERAAHGIYPIIDDQIPSGKQMAGFSLSLDGTTVRRHWTLIDIPLDIIKAQKVSRINMKRDDVLGGGYTVPSTISTALGGKVLQTRDGDRANWLTSQAVYSAAIAAGHGSDEIATFRAVDNSVTILSANEGAAVLLAMAAWGATNTRHSWDLKDAVADATSAAAVAAVDETAGWS